MSEKRAWTAVVGLIALLLGIVPLEWPLQNVDAATEGAPTSSTEPVDLTSTTDPVDTVATTVVASSTQPIETVTTTVPVVSTTESGDTVATTVPGVPSTEPVETVATTTVVSTTTASCDPFVDGDGPISLPPGCEFAPPPAAVRNPSVAPGCGLTVMLVVDRSSSMAAAGGSVQAVLGTLLDALSRTGSTVALADFADGAAARIDYTALDGARGAFDGYLAGYSPGGTTDLDAGLAAANVGSPDLTVVITDGVTNANIAHEPNATAGQQVHPVSSAVERANQIKADGSRIFVVGLGDLDSGAVAAISGPGSGTDIAASDYTTVADFGSLGASLEALATGGCPASEATSNQLTELPVESAAPVTTPDPTTETVEMTATSEASTPLAAAAITAAVAPSAPRSYRVSGVGNGRVSLAWIAPASGPPPSGYLLAYAPAGGTWRSINLGGRTSWTLTGLRNGTRYYLYLYALNGIARSPAATATAVLPSGTPRSYRVTGVGNGRVSLAWSAPAAGPPSSGYQLAYAPAGGTWRSINFGGRTSWTLTGLRNGTKYYLYLYAVHSGFRSPAARTTALLPSGTPRNYRVIGVGNGRVSLAWSAPAAGPPSSGYLLAYAPAGGTWRSINLGGRTSWTLTGLRNGTKYYVYLYAVHNGFRSPAATAWANVASTVPAGPSPGDGRFPTQASVGVPAGWTPTRTINGDYTVTTPGAVVQDLRINGGLIIAAPNVTVRRVEIIGGEINNMPGGTCNEGLVIEDSTLRDRDSTEPSVKVGGYTARRVEISNSSEGFRVGGRFDGCGPVVIEDSWVKVEPPAACATNHDFDWHGDGVQGYDGNHLTIRNTYLELVVGPGNCGGTAPIFYPDGDGNLSATVDGLIVKGGGYPFRVGRGSVNDLNIVAGSWVYGPIEVNCSAMASWEAEIVTLDAAGQPVRVRSQPCDT